MGLGGFEAVRLLLHSFSYNCGDIDRLNQREDHTAASGPPLLAGGWSSASGLLGGLRAAPLGGQ